MGSEGSKLNQEQAKHVAAAEPARQLCYDNATTTDARPLAAMTRGRACWEWAHVMMDVGRAAEAYKALQLGCEHADADACFSQAAMLYAGDGLDSKDAPMPAQQAMPLARDLSERACELGSMEGCFNAAVMAGDGLGGPRSQRTQRVHLERACAGGFAAACFNLALHLAEAHPAEDLAADRPRAARLFESCCERGLPGACVSFALALERGDLDGTPQVERAIELLGVACSAGDGEACYNAAIVLAHAPQRRPGAHADHWRARGFYQKACDAGVSQACTAKDYYDKYPPREPPREPPRTTGA